MLNIFSKVMRIKKPKINNLNIKNKFNIENKYIIGKDKNLKINLYEYFKLPIEQRKKL